MKKLLLLAVIIPLIGIGQKWEKKYDFVDNCICGLSKVKKDGKVGYVTKEGVEVIKLIYNDGLTFKEGYAAVQKGAKWMYFDSTGKEITAAIFDDALSFSNGFAAVSKGSQYGYINYAGQVVIPFQFNNAGTFAENVAPVSNAKGFWGYIDETGKWTIKPLYDYADSFENGEARVVKGEKVFFIDKQNNTLHN